MPFKLSRLCTLGDSQTSCVWDASPDKILKFELVKSVFVAPNNGMETQFSSSISIITAATCFFYTKLQNQICRQDLLKLKYSHLVSAKWWIVDSSAYQSYAIDDLNINPYLRSQQSSDSSIWWRLVTSPKSRVLCCFNHLTITTIVVALHANLSSGNCASKLTGQAAQYYYYYLHSISIECLCISNMFKVAQEMYFTMLTRVRILIVWNWLDPISETWNTIFKMKLQIVFNCTWCY